MTNLSSELHLVSVFKLHVIFNFSMPIWKLDSISVMIYEIDDCRHWVMGSTGACGIGRLWMLIRKGCLLLPSSAHMTMLWSALQNLSQKMDVELYTGILLTQNITVSFGAGTWTKNIVWNFLRTNTSFIAWSFGTYSIIFLTRQLLPACCKLKCYA